MSRIRKAMIAASFGYMQYGLALVTGLVLVPLVLHHVGPRSYGLWLASGELLGYAATADLGVLGVLPWLFAEADGRRDRDLMRRLLANGLLVGSVVGVGFALFVTMLWHLLPTTVGLGAEDQASLRAPLALLVVATVIALPFKVFSGLLAGLQDVRFNGRLAVAQAAAGVVVTLVLLGRGHGLLALSAGSVTSLLVVSSGTFLRARLLAPDLFRGWPRPTWTAQRDLLVNGTGVWLGGFGWQLLSASNGLVMTSLGRPEWVAVYACSAKLSAMATQLAWVIPDAGLIGLAQVNGERDGAARMGALVVMMLRLHLLLAGGATCLLLAVNPTFVSHWVGSSLFGGSPLNALLSVAIVTSSLVHGLLAAVSVLGRRLPAGLLTLATGLAQIGGAWVLGRVFGLPGIAAAAILAAAFVAVPAGVRLLRPALTMSLISLWRGLVCPWAVRAAPLAFAAGLVGLGYQRLAVPITIALTVAIGGAYLWQMRPLYAGLPADPRVTRWLTSLRILPDRPAATAEQM